MPEPAKRLPSWLKIKLPEGRRFGDTAKVLAEAGVDTVCRGARCPNRSECFSSGTAAFLVMGPSCTRACGFCSIDHEPPVPLDPTEPARLAEAASRLGLRYVVVTSVTRDDLPDGGAAHFAAVSFALRQRVPGVLVELLVPDFQGRLKDVETVCDSLPDVFNHNLETVPRLYPRMRAGADYRASLDVLSHAARRLGARPVKTGLMAGLGETPDELRQTLSDAARAGVRAVTVGQYLPPTRRHPPVDRFVTPGEFDELAAFARGLGLVAVCGPYVRSSHHAAETYAQLQNQKSLAVAQEDAITYTAGHDPHL